MADERQETTSLEHERPGFYPALARAIRSLRTARGLERKELADRAGISYPYLSEIEGGKKRPSSQTLLAVAEALAIRPHELMALAETLANDRVADAAGAEVAEPPAAPAPAAAMDGPEPRRASRFFHAPAPASVVAPSQHAVPAPNAPLSQRTGPPRTLAAVVHELRGYLERMAADDVERVLDLARRLSQGGSRRDDRQ
jgi:transcriptional regulator with XRE-family HTH domain